MITAIVTVNFKRSENAKSEKGIMIYSQGESNDSQILIDCAGKVVDQLCNYTERAGIALHNLEIK